MKCQRLRKLPVVFWTDSLALLHGLVPALLDDLYELLGVVELQLLVCRHAARYLLTPVTISGGEFIFKNWTTNLTDWLKPSVFGGIPGRLINGPPDNK